MTDAEEGYHPSFMESVSPHRDVLDLLDRHMRKVEVKGTQIRMNSKLYALKWARAEILVLRKQIKELGLASPIAPASGLSPDAQRVIEQLRGMGEDSPPPTPLPSEPSSPSTTDDASPTVPTT